MKISTRALIVLVGMVAAILTGVAPAQAKTYKECEDIEGDTGPGLVCGYVNISRVAGSNDLIVTRHSIRVKSELSNSELGYGGMYDIHFKGREVVSGKTRHAHDNASTDTRLWAHEKNFRIKSGYGRFSFSGKINWDPGLIGWPDESFHMSYSID